MNEVGGGSGSGREWKKVEVRDRTRQGGVLEQLVEDQDNEKYLFLSFPLLHFLGQ
jgi:hypothetical protein